MNPRFYMWMKTERFTGKFMYDGKFRGHHFSNWAYRMASEYLKSIKSDRIVDHADFDRWLAGKVGMSLDAVYERSGIC